jgi:hypothetical protein
MISFDLTAPIQALTSAFGSLSTYVYGVAFLVTLIGYYAQVWKHRREPTHAIEALVIIALCVMFASSVSFWRPYAVNLFYYPAQQLAQANSVFQLNQAINNFFSGAANLAKDPANGGTNGPSTLQQAAHFLWNLGQVTRAALLGLVVQMLVDVLTVIGGLIALPFYFFQRVLVEALFTFMPIPICALSVPALRDRAAAYLSMTASVLAWPLGFAIVAAAANTVFQVPFSSGGTVAGTVGAVLEPILRILVAAIIMIFGSILVPPTMFFLALYGGTHIDPIMSAARSIPMLGSFARR